MAQQITDARRKNDWCRLRIAAWSKGYDPYTLFKIPCLVPQASLEKTSKLQEDVAYGMGLQGSTPVLQSSPMYKGYDSDSPRSIDTSVISARSDTEYEIESDHEDISCEKIALFARK